MYVVGAFNQPGKGPSRGPVHDCENFADGSFAALTRIGALFRGHMEVLTSEVRFTDRIFKFKHNYIDHVFTDTVATSTSFDTLYYSITGNDSSHQ